MKKYVLIIISIALLFIIGCSNTANINSNSESNSNSKNDTNYSDIIEKSSLDITEGTNILADIDDFCDIIFFNSDQVIYMRDGTYNMNLDAANVIFYHYDMKTQVTTQLTEVENFKLSFSGLACLDDRIYYPFSAIGDYGEVEYFLMISLTDLTTDITQSNTIDSMVTRLEAADNQVFRYYQRAISADETDFYIDKMNFSGSDQNIIHEKYKEGGGEILVSSCIYQNSIFTFSTKLGVETKYVISEFDLDGNLLNEYQVDLESFLKLKEVDDTDAIFRIFRVGQYIILNTLNNRIKIYQIKENELSGIETPASFEEMLGARVIENDGSENEYMYFQSCIKNAEFYIFDSVDCEVYEYKLIADGSPSFDIRRDADGNIMVITQDNERNYKYYFIEKNAFKNK